jgi:sugar transferase (PEP-CTERM/EpsH1 system associated)
MATYLAAPALQEVPRLVDFVDVDSQKWFDYSENSGRLTRGLFRLEGRRVRNLEQQLAGRSHAVTVVSVAEANLLRSFAPNAPVHAISNGVDLDYFHPQPTNQITARPVCVFVGALDYRANVDGVTWFCQEVWPQVCARFPTAAFVLVGRRPAPQVRRLAALPNVELVGEVEEVLPYLQRARVAVIPLRIARGIQNKVLEALAAGKPVVASPQALEGLDVVPGEHAYQADTPAQWVTAITTLLTQDDECRRLADAGRDFVCQRHCWPACLQPLDKLLRLADSAAAPELACLRG